MLCSLSVICLILVLVVPDDQMTVTLNVDAGLLMSYSAAAGQMADDSTSEGIPIASASVDEDEKD